MNENIPSLRDSFLEKYPKYGVILAMFEKANKCSATWSNITKPRLAKFVAYMDGQLARSSVKTYCAMFKALLNLYNEDVKLPKGYESILSPKGDVSQNVWLTDAEIMKLLDYGAKKGVEWLVRNQFCLGALTGARHSDYCLFTENNIVNGMLVYVSQKTHIKSEVPLSPAVERLLKEYGQAGFFGKTVSDVTFNDTIRAICRNVGINERVKLYNSGEISEGEKWEYVSSHTARRSFATNLYIRGADLYSISVLMGHKSTIMTEKYIVCGLRKMPDIVMEYFRQFK